MADEDAHRQASHGVQHEGALRLPERRRPRRKERSAQGEHSVNLVDLANRACEPLSSRWPEDKVCIGMRVCKDLRGMLVMVPLVRLKVRRKVEDPVLAIRWLSRFHGKVQLHAGERIREGEGFGGRERRALPSFDARCRKDKVEEGELGRSIADLMTMSDKQQQQGGQHCSAIQWISRLTSLSLVSLLLGEDIARIAGALHRMTMLESLELECIQQGTEESWIQCFCASLPQLQRLKKLSLARGKLSDDGIAVLSSCFPLCTSLHDLDLSRSSLRAGGIVLWTALSRCTRLSALNLSHNSISPTGSQRFADVLTCMTSLTRLNLASTALRSEGIYPVATSLKNLKQLRHLDLSSNAIVLPGAAQLAEALHGATLLETLDLSNNFFGSEGTRHLSTCIGACNSLVTLRMSENAIGLEGVQPLVQVVANCSRLSFLDLSRNSMGAEGLHLMSAILPRLPSLHSINFSSINAGDGGIGHLSAHLPNCCALQSLDLSCNKFRATGAWRLAWALPTSLRILNICNNDIGDEGARHLSGALPHCDALEDLDLTSTGIGDEGAGLLAEILPRCSSLRILSLSHTMMGATGARGLMDCVDRCANPPELNLEGIFHTC